MSKSLTRVKDALTAHGLDAPIVETPASTRTAAEAATAVRVEIDQIVKSILFQGGSGGLYLFLTAGGNQVDLNLASRLAGAALSRADATAVRAITGFAIGGVSPVGHLQPSPIWMDPRLCDFARVWAAAGTPHHIFAVAPAVLQRVTGAMVADFTVSAPS